MKKIVVLLVACMMMSAGICSAKVLIENDEFTGGNTATSIFQCDINMKNKIDWLSLEATNTKESKSYKIEADVTTFKNFGLSDKILEINLDGENTYSLSVLNRQEMKIVSDYLYILNYKVTQEVVDKLKTANRVALRFTQNNGNQFVYVLPDEVLAEWKEVINMDK